MRVSLVAGLPVSNFVTCRHDYSQVFTPLAGLTGDFFTYLYRVYI